MKHIYFIEAIKEGLNYLVELKTSSGMVISINMSVSGRF